MIRLIKILCWFLQPDFKWFESETEYRPAYTDVYGNNWMECHAEFYLHFGYRENYEEYSAWLPMKYHRHYRLETHWDILKMVFKNVFNRRFFK